MLTTISSLADLKRNKQTINNLFLQNGEIYLHSYLSLESQYLSKKGKDFLIFFDKDNSFMTAFEKRSENVWECSIAGFPMLFGKNLYQEEIAKLLEDIKARTQSVALYFPLVYKDSQLFRLLEQIPGMTFWKRLPSPIVNGDLSEKVVWRRVVGRFGSRAERQRKKFEKDLQVGSVGGRDIEKVISEIELNSWKSRCKQDMLSRDNQFAYYVNIVKKGLADITVAFDQNGKGTAFRIESLVNGVLYVIKWSYSEEYKKYSPGFYLLTIDLFKKINGMNLKYVDLYGSPDNLKKLLRTNLLKRVDLCYSSDKQVVNTLKEKKLRFDQKLDQNYKASKSIKAVYNK